MFPLVGPLRYDHSVLLVQVAVNLLASDLFYFFAANACHLLS